MIWWFSLIWAGLVKKKTFSSLKETFLKKNLFAPEARIRSIHPDMFYKKSIEQLHWNKS